MDAPAELVSSARSARRSPTRRFSRSNAASSPLPAADTASAASDADSSYAASNPEQRRSMDLSYHRRKNRKAASKKLLEKRSQTVWKAEV